MVDLIAKAKEIIAIYGLRVVGAIAILLIGWLVSKLIRKIVQRLMENSKTDSTLVSFVGHLVYIALMSFVIIAALNNLGVQTASFIAVLGAAGLAIGLALQGSLSNFAAGVILILFRPFKVDDLIEGGGVLGVVEEIQIFTTVLRTPDNKKVIIPNANLTGCNIINYTSNGTRRIDMVVGVGYNDNIPEVKKIIADVLAQDNRILADPETTIAVVEHGDSSINLVVRPWVKVDDYWDVHFQSMEQIKIRFDKEGISIPFPQRDVHVYKHD